MSPALSDYCARRSRASSQMIFYRKARMLRQIRADADGALRTKEQPSTQSGSSE